VLPHPYTLVEWRLREVEQIHGSQGTETAKALHWIAFELRAHFGNRSITCHSPRERLVLEAAHEGRRARRELRHGKDLGLDMTELLPAHGGWRNARVHARRDLLGAFG